jgi:hypothetical protein
LTVNFFSKPEPEAGGTIMADSPPHHPTSPIAPAKPIEPGLMHNPMLDNALDLVNRGWSINRAVSVDKTLPDYRGIDRPSAFRWQVGDECVHSSDHVGFAPLGDINSRSASRPDR